MEIILGHINADPFILRRSSQQDIFAGEHLRNWVKKWQASGPNMGRFVRDNPELWESLVRHSRDNPPYVLPQRDGDGVVIAWPLPAVVRNAGSYAAQQARVAQAIKNGARLTAAAAARIRARAEEVLQGKSTPSPSPEAFFLFLSFLNNPLRKRLGGPCARCGRYFLRRTERNPKVYCSRLCGWRTTGRAAIEQQRQKDREDKLRRSAKAAQDWTTARTQLDWKQWVSKNEPDISGKFLTRAVNKGELKAPVRQ
jgi:hypothetical protein